MRVLKEVLVLAVIVLVLAYAARQLEGFDAGKMETGVPPLSSIIEQLFGWVKGETGKTTPPAQPAK